MAIRLKIDQEDPNIAMNPLSIWLDKTSFYSPEKLLARRKLWEFCIYFDTCIGLAGGLPLVIYETAYGYLLSLPSETSLEAESRLEAAMVGVSSSTEKARLEKIKQLLVNDRVRSERGMNLLCEVIQDPPDDTVYNIIKSHIEPRPACGYGLYNVIMNQLSFILRRVIRVNYTRRTGKNSETENQEWNPGKAIVESLMPPPQDVVVIHNALVDFYSSLPAEYKPFKSFSHFFPVLSSGSDSVFTETFDPTQVHFVNITTNLICALVMLHLPRTDDSRAIFKLDASNFESKRVASAEVVLVARKAM
ncbi:hypothetical protein HDU99_002385, partial [Rhizoclosmatium hyalinum]